MREFLFEDLADIIPQSITCVACIWFFCRYLCQPQKSLGYVLVLVLALSDFIFSANILLFNLVTPQALNETTGLIFFLLYYTSLDFSIFWASGIAFLVYRSLKGFTSDPKSIIVKAILVTATFSAGHVWGFFNASTPSLIKLILLFGPLMLSLTLTFVFYWMSISYLKSLDEHELRSTRIYVKNLKLYSLIQLITYGPLAVNLFIPIYLNEGIDTSVTINPFLEGLASLSGLFSVLIFYYQGNKIHNKPTTRQLEEDLTEDVV